MTKPISVLSKIDRVVTKRKVEDVLESIRIYKQFGTMRKEMGMSERTYRRVKARALYKLAFALRLEVYQTEEIGMNDERYSAHT
ncbi:hypothetical protein P4283_26275 [Bacillus thuringiensis]|nr:hypothetical protein [Bacillus thuringiensis]